MKNILIIKPITLAVLGTILSSSTWAASEIPLTHSGTGIFDISDAVDNLPSLVNKYDYVSAVNNLSISGVAIAINYDANIFSGSGVVPAHPLVEAPAEYEPVAITPPNNNTWKLAGFKKIPDIGDGCPWAADATVTANSAASTASTERIYGYPTGSSGHFTLAAVTVGNNFAFTENHNVALGACRYVRNSVGTIIHTGIASGLDTQAQAGQVFIQNNGTLQATSAGSDVYGILANLDISPAPLIIENTGDIYANETTGNYAYGIDASSYGVYVRSTTSDPKTGSNSMFNKHFAVAGTGQEYSRDGAYQTGVLVKNTAKITVDADFAAGISAYDGNEGYADIINSGDISVQGQDSTGLILLTTNGSANVKTTGRITVTTSAPTGRTGGIDVTAQASSITTPTALAINSVAANGIDRLNGRYLTEAAVDFQGSIYVAGKANQDVFGISAISHGTAVSVTVPLDGRASVIVDGTIDVSDVTSGVGSITGVMLESAQSNLQVKKGAVITGGVLDTISKLGSGVQYDVKAAVETHPDTTLAGKKTAITAIRNQGLIQAADDQTILSVTTAVGGATNTASGALANIYNNGTIIGYITGGNENTVLYNDGTWQLRNQKKDGTVAEVKSQFYGATNNGGDIIFNSGTITLKSKDAVTPANAGKNAQIILRANNSIDLAPNNTTASDRRPSATGFYDMGGLIDLSNNFAGDDIDTAGQPAGTGNILVISSKNGGIASLPTDGALVNLTAPDTVFYTGGGTIRLDVLLNSDAEGAANGGLKASRADRVIIDGKVATAVDSKTFAPIPTYIEVNALTGSEGAETQGDGILLIETNGSPAGAFALKKPLQYGTVEYRLVRGDKDGKYPNNWYLRTAPHTTVPVMGWVGLVGMAAALAVSATRRCKDA